MNDLTSHHAARSREPESETIKETDLQQLRNLILQPLKTDVDQILARLDDSQQQAMEMSYILPAAIRLRCSRDKKLALALAPMLAEAIQSSVKKNKRLLAEAIFPVIGPAVRRSVLNTLQSMIQSFNQLLDQSFSVRGIKWRLEALRTGKSFAEVVMLHTLIYQVEQVFLLHRPTGLLLQHVSAETVSAQDPDLVSGMLTAIQDFVNDSFGSRDGSALESLRVGDRSIFVEDRTHVILAAVVRGEPPLELKTMLQDVVDEIQIVNKDALEAFSGDTEPFEPLKPLLVECLKQKSKASAKRISPLFWILLLALAGLLGGFLYQLWHRNQNWQSYLEHLSGVPGIVVTSSGRTFGHYSVSGFRDPLTIDPAELALTYSLSADRLQSEWELFHSIQPAMLTRRLEQYLQPPDTVRLTLEKSTLTVSGSAGREWIDNLHRTARILPGISSIRTDDLIDSDRQKFEALIADIQRQSIHFDSGRFDINPETAMFLEKISGKIKQLLQLQYPLRRNVFIDLVGHADPVGVEKRNLELSRVRAEQVFSFLVRKGIPGQIMRPVGMGSQVSRTRVTTPDQEHLYRRVNLIITVLAPGRPTEG